METKQQHTNTQVIEANKVPSPSSSSSSSSPSPSHEFSFSTISLHNNYSYTPHLLTNNKNNPKSLLQPQSHPPLPPFAIDLSPADDIFFHGHLLPLHLLSHLPSVSPRSSTNSIDSFTLPIIRDFSDNIDHRQIIPNFQSENFISAADDQKPMRSKPKSFSFFRWRPKGCEINIGDGELDKEKQKKKMRFEVSRVLKRYLRMVRPLLFFKGRRSENLQIHRKQPFNSFSGNLSWRSKQAMRGRRGEFSSAPASMRTSPTNSGLLVATAGKPCCGGGDSTMEELQAAIQAAIAHCKNSIATEDKIKC